MMSINQEHDEGNDWACAGLQQQEFIRLMAFVLFDWFYSEIYIVL